LWSYRAGLSIAGLSLVPISLTLCFNRLADIEKVPK